MTASPSVERLTDRLARVPPVFRDRRAVQLDAVVADLYLKGGAAVEPLEAAFPGVTKDGAVVHPALK